MLRALGVKGHDGSRQYFEMAGVSGCTLIHTAVQLILKDDGFFILPIDSREVSGVGEKG